MAFTVAAAFEQLCKNLRFSDDNLSKISNRYHSITKRINTDYWKHLPTLLTVCMLVHMGVIQRFSPVT